LRRFREACKVQRDPISCFWLRHDSEVGKPWMEALKPLLIGEGLPDAASAKDVWVVAVKGEARKATVFTKTVVDRELAQRDLVKWLGELQRSGLELEGQADWPFQTLEELPQVPEALAELYGPKGMAGRLYDKILKVYTNLSEMARESGGAWMQLLFFGVLIGWPMLSQQLNNMAQSAAGVTNPKGQEKSQHSIPIGSEVVVDGLRQATEYNGQRGKVLAHMAGIAGQPTKYRVQLRSLSDEKVTINVSPVILGMTFVDGGRVTTVPAGCQAAILGVKPDWIIYQVAGQSVEGESKETLTRVFEDATKNGSSYPVIFVTPKVLAIRADNLCRASH